MGAPATRAEPSQGIELRHNKRRLDAAASKNNLIEATISCMADYGPVGVTIDRITGVAGVSRGLVRHHFGSKRLLLLSAFQRLADEQRAAFSAGESGTDPDPVTALRTAVATSFREAAAAPARAGAWFGFWQATLGDPELRAINAAVYAEERERYSQLFREAAAAHGLDIDHRRAGDGLAAIGDGAWNELLLEGSNIDLDQAVALCDHYIDMELERGRTNR